MMYVFIGCSSKDNLDKIYRDSAIEIANYLSLHHYKLMCGGVTGIMKTVQEVFKANKQEVTIVGVKGYHDNEVRKLKNAYLCDSIKERKNMFIKKADLILILPGGIGTIDELFTVIESKRAKEHNIPIIIANINQYYTHLIKQLNTIYQEGFGDENEINYNIANSSSEVIQYIEQLGGNHE